jgi:hypothetical protein
MIWINLTTSLGLDHPPKFPKFHLPPAQNCNSVRVDHICPFTA